MKLKSRLLNLIGLLGLAILPACQTQVFPHQPSVRFQPQYRVFDETENLSDRYLCSVQPSEGNSLVKVLDLQTQQMRSIFVPGQVKTLAGSQSSQKIYAGTENGQVYEVDIQQNTVQYFLSFAQAGLTSVEFVVNQQELFAVGQQGQQGSLMRLNLQQKTWKPIAYNLKTGRLAWGGQAQTLQILNMGSNGISRTTVDIATRQVTNEDCSIKQPEEDNFYNGVFSPNGRYLYASVNNRIERFERNGAQFQRLTPIELNHVKARYLALSSNGQTLYVSHDQPHRVTRIRLNGNGAGYSLEEMSFAGNNNQLVVF